MKARGILMNAEMVRATLEGRKLQTRRPVKPQPVTGSPLSIFRGGVTFIKNGEVKADWSSRVINPEGMKQFCPFGVPGDRLYVRETWSTGESLDRNSPSQIAEMCREANYLKPWAPIHYHADSHQVNQDTLADFGDGWGKGRPSIHMPRWASRIDLEIIAVRVERVQSIITADIDAEGVDNGKSNKTMGYRHDNMQRMAWRDLWEALYRKGGDGPYRWDLNPWVWVVEFKVI